MGIKDFFSFDTQKMIILLFLVLFAPLPFFLLFAGGLAPPILILMWLPELIKDSINFLFFDLLFFIIHVLFAYLVSCLIVWVLRKVSYQKKIQWIIISTFLVILVLISFFLPIYNTSGIGGGSHQMSSWDLYEGIFIKTLGCEFIKDDKKGDWLGSEKDWCYYKKAETSNKDSFCSKIKVQWIKNDCYGRLAKSNRDLQLCNFISSSNNPDDPQKTGYLGATYKEECFNEVALVTRNVNVCKEIENIGYRESCYWRVARETRNEQICELIQDNMTKINCIADTKCWPNC